MTHYIYTKMKFEDDTLLNNYLKITKKFLIPQLNKQTCKDFNWVLLINKDHLDYLYSQLQYPFIPVFSPKEYKDHQLSSNAYIQTRHDCDDWMHERYIEELQRIANHCPIDKFLIQSNPLRIYLDNSKEPKLLKYSNVRCSMHLTLCQKEVTNSIEELPHGQMHKLCTKIITLQKTYTWWIIHGHNKTFKRVSPPNL